MNDPVVIDEVIEYCLMANVDFAEWLNTELQARGWPQTLLAERAGLSDTQLSRLMRRERGPGIDAIKGIARAFSMPVETVMRAAGWLPPTGVMLPEVGDWSRRLNGLPGETRGQAVQAMENILVAFERAASPGRR